jgi:DNA repair protein RadA/Sms
MTADGIEEVPDPSGLFLTARDEPVAGTCVTVVLEGRRAMPAEVQALVTPSPLPQPRRGVSGLDKNRMDMLVAVTQKHGRMKLYERDVYLATVGGQRLAEPSADLAAALALASAFEDVPVPSDVVALGEVALSGDIRPVTGLARRLAEAQRLGFKRALVPPGPQTDEYARKPGGMVTVTVADVGRAILAVRSF